MSTGSHTFSSWAALSRSAVGLGTAQSNGDQTHLCAKVGGAGRKCLLRGSPVIARTALASSTWLSASAPPSRCRSTRSALSRPAPVARPEHRGRALIPGRAHHRYSAALERAGGPGSSELAVACLRGRGAAKLMLRDFEGAAADSRRAADEGGDAEHAAALCAGKALLALGRAAEARAAFDRALSAVPPAARRPPPAARRPPPAPLPPQAAPYPSILPWAGAGFARRQELGRGGAGRGGGGCARRAQARCALRRAGAPRPARRRASRHRPGLTARRAPRTAWAGSDGVLDPLAAAGGRVSTAGALSSAPLY